MRTKIIVLITILNNYTDIDTDPENNGNNYNNINYGIDNTYRMVLLF